MQSRTSRVSEYVKFLYIERILFDCGLIHNIVSNARRSDGWTFGMSANNDNEHANHPGPGFYENNASSPTQYGKFGRETRGKETT